MNVPIYAVWDKDYGQLWRDVICVTSNGNVSPGQPEPVCSSCADLVYTTRSHRVEGVTSISRFILHCHKPSENPQLVLFSIFILQSFSISIIFWFRPYYFSVWWWPHQKFLGNNFLLPYEIQRTGGGYLSVRYLSCYYRRGTVIELQHHHPHPWKDDKLANSLLPEPGKDVNLRLKFIQM